MISVHSPFRQLVVEPMFDDAAQKYVIEYGVPPMLALSDVVFKKKINFFKKMRLFTKIDKTHHT